MRKQIKYLLPLSLIGVGLLFYENDSREKLSAQTNETMGSYELGDKIYEDESTSIVDSSLPTNSSETSNSESVETTQSSEKPDEVTSSSVTIEESSVSVSIIPVPSIPEPVVTDIHQEKEKTIETEAAVEEVGDEEIEESIFIVSRNQTTEEFIEAIGYDAQTIAWEHDLYASVMIAQAILETGSGNSSLSRSPNHNLFGIKGNFKGKSVYFSTQEDDGKGKMYTIQSGFRKYPSYKESLIDYAKLLRGGISGNEHFYKNTWKTNQKNYQKVTSFLTGRYATDIHYGKKLNALIKTYELTKFDEKPGANKEKKKSANTNQKDLIQANGADDQKILGKKVEQTEYGTWNAGKVLSSQSIYSEGLDTDSNKTFYWQREPAKKILGTHVVK